MPPFNNFVFDEPFNVESSSVNDIHIESPSSFKQELDSEDPLLKFAFPPRRQKSVSFNNEVEVQYLPSHHYWSEDERLSRWNSDDDYTNFQLDIFSTIYLLRNDPESIDDICHCSRGVECRDPLARRRRRKLKQEAWDVVFKRQIIQRRTHDDINGCKYLVARMYSHATQAAMRLALDFAAQDEIEANNIRSEGDQCCDEEVDFFDDSWISAIASSHSESSSLSSSTELSRGENKNTDDNEFGFFVWGESSAFDNSWLRMDS